MNRGFKENSRSGNMLICICNVVSTHINVKSMLQEGRGKKRDCKSHLPNVDSEITLEGNFHLPHYYSLFHGGGTFLKLP
jgi:hypothetical protein